MKVLVAPNAMKGSLSALRAAEIIARALPEGWESVLCPIADGGDGTLDCLVRASKGQYFNATVTGPLPEMRVSARWGVMGDRRTAIVEMAEASGLRLLNPNQYSATYTTTRGVGEMIVRIIDEGFRDIVIGLGGSATNDGGAGCAQALGVRFLNAKGEQLPPGGIHLQRLERIDSSGKDKRLQECNIVCLCDVNCALFGPSGTSRVYAQQKGATDDEIELLDSALKHYSEMIVKELHFNPGTVPGCGAAGGLTTGLIAFCKAQAVSGADYILDLIGFDNLLRDCDAVITAEGRIDEQTAKGKGIAGIAARANSHGKPVIVFAGRIEGDRTSLCRQIGVRSIYQISPNSLSNEDAIANAEKLLDASIRNVASSW